MKLTFIGNGNMAEALIAGLVEKYEIEVYGRNAQSLALVAQKYNVSVIEIKESIDITDKNIILCVKPNSLDDLSPKLKGTAKSLFSVLAGTTLENLNKKVPNNACVRAMPNLAAKYSKSMTTLTGDNSLQEEAFNIFDSIGSSLWLSTEKEIDIATGVAGSGPAFLALVAEALSDGGVNAGLKRDDANSLVKGLFEGFAPLLNDNSPSSIKDGVMSPGGTTAAGYSALEENNTRNSFIKAIDSAYQRAIELGKK
jgi:pyrroline-5-carboxylate reductase